MNWLDKLERKYPRFGIRNITLYLVLANAIGYLLLGSPVLSYCKFNVYHILHGQIWRLFSWILIPSNGSAFTMVIFLLCAASWGRSLEMMLGTFRISVFVIGGIVLSDILGFVFYFVSGLVLAANGLGGIGIASSMGMVGFGFSPVLTTYYLILTILMQMALMYPDAEVRMWFILPMRMKWMFWLLIAELVYEVGSIFYFVLQLPKYPTSVLVMGAFAETASVFFALLNLLVFYLASKNHVSRKHKKRQREFQQQFRAAEPRPGSNIARHKCAVCGRTDITNPELEFRYCSKCPGGYEYCNEHLFTHVHH
ncbi:MAG: hypothetical protein K6G13_08790 [Agathobacter sp.]|uniref:hypothetical protein n=1 Tax=Agathobacter sp. TaxID=2021311 RepID=UPI00258CFAE0|nr:hypothetical protein [Agathobacter sp.]MCR5678111.1 hypothetical protein [Agathobacter sp.]